MKLLLLSLSWMTVFMVASPQASSSALRKCSIFVHTVTDANAASGWQVAQSLKEFLEARGLSAEKDFKIGVTQNGYQTTIQVSNPNETGISPLTESYLDLFRRSLPAIQTTGLSGTLEEQAKYSRKSNVNPFLRRLQRPTDQPEATILQKLEAHFGLVGRETPGRVTHLNEMASPDEPASVHYTFESNERRAQPPAIAVRWISSREIQWAEMATEIVSSGLFRTEEQYIGIERGGGGVVANLDRGRLSLGSPLTAFSFQFMRSIGFAREESDPNSLPFAQMQGSDAENSGNRFDFSEDPEDFSVLNPKNVSKVMRVTAELQVPGWWTTTRRFRLHGFHLQSHSPERSRTLLASEPLTRRGDAWAEQLISLGFDEEVAHNLPYGAQLFFWSHHLEPSDGKQLRGALLLLIPYHWELYFGQKGLAVLKARAQRDSQFAFRRAGAPKNPSSMRIGKTTRP